MSKSVNSGATALCLLLFLLAPCGAQLMNTGAITGTVVDQDQTSIPGAVIEITNSETHNKAETVTNANGSFSTVGLPSGRYEVTVSGKGFASYTETGIYLSPAAVYSINALLKPAAVSTAVTVQASVERVQTDTAEIASRVSQEQVENLPLNGRSYQGLAALMPGVTNMQAGTALGTGGYITQNSMSVNGTGQTATLYTVDGMWNMQTSNMQETTITPNPDSIEEVKVLQNNYSAEYNAMGTAAVIVQTKSGTEVFHGGAWEFLRNTVFDARNFYSVNVPAEQGNIFGWHLGGPVYIPHLFSKDHKTFFYVNQQWVRQNQPMVANGAAVPAAMRGMGTPDGNAVFPTTGPYASTIKDPLNGQAFAGNAIPASRLNANALAYLNALEPLPNNQTNVFNNYLNPNPATNAQLNQEYKVDQNFRPNTVSPANSFTKGRPTRILADSGWEPSFPTTTTFSARIIHWRRSS